MQDSRFAAFIGPSPPSWTMAAPHRERTGSPEVLQEGASRQFPGIQLDPSDRMICCKGIGGEGNEFNTTSHPKLGSIGYIATLKIARPSGGQGLLIHAFCSGHWSFAVSPADEDDDGLPDWKIERAWGTVNAHSVTLILTCPSDAVVTVGDRMLDAGE